jgi:hypothetical protein
MRAVTFLKAFMQQIGGNKDLLGEDEVAERLQICNDCTHYRGDRCSLCGCCATAKSSYFNKLAYPKEKCPLAKWPIRDK